MAESTDRGNTQAGRYAAFISYSHADEEFGDWLHKRLESYQVPSALVGRDGPNGPIQKRLGKVFRDRADLSAAHDLGAEIRQGLEQADALIVLCSPRSCASTYVNQEIAAFKALGKGSRIFAAIVDGEPHAAGNPNYSAADECFPPALIYQLNANGALTATPEPNEPIAADFRDGKDGRENGSLKIIAGLLGVGLDELVQRERQAERARRRRANLIAAAMAVLALGAVVGAGVGWWNYNLAEERAVAERLARNEADTQRGIAQTQTGIAVTKAEEARIQELAAKASAAEASTQRDAARNSLGQIFAERAWKALADRNFPSAARYAIAGMQIGSGNRALFRSLLGSLLFNTGNSFALLGHGGGVVSLAFSSNGKRLVSTGMEDGTALVWDAATGRQIAELRGHGTFCSFEFDPMEHKFEEGPCVVHTAAFNPQGDRVVTGSDDSRVLVWDANDGRVIRQLDGHDDSVYAASFSADGAYLVTASANVVNAWDAVDGRRLWSIHGHGFQEGLGLRVDRVAPPLFSADGRSIAIRGPGDTAEIVDAASGTPLYRPVRGEGEDQRSFRALAYGMQGQRAVLAAQGNVVVWDLVAHAQCAELQGLPGSGYVFSADGSRVAAADASHAVHVWDANTGSELFTLQGHQGKINKIQFSPDGAMLATASDDATARVWRLSDQRIVAVLRAHAGAIEDVAFSPDGRALATASLDESVRLWRVDDFILAPPDATALRTRNAAIHPDGRWVRVYELGSAFARAEVVDAAGNGLHPLYFEGRPKQAVFSPDGHLIALAMGGAAGYYSFARNDFVQLMDARSSAGVGTLRGEIGNITALAFSADGRTLVTAGGDNLMRVWDVQSHRMLRSVGPLASASWIDLSPDGTRLVTTSGDGARIWDFETGQLLATISGSASSYVFSADGRRLLSERRTWNVERLVQPMSELEQDACARLLGWEGAQFSRDEIETDPLVRDVWLRGNPNRRVCAPAARR